MEVREIVKLSIEYIYEKHNIQVTEDEKRKLLEDIAYEHAKKHNYPYINQYGIYN